MDASSRIRPWRTAFLTLRDESLSSTSSSSLLPLLRNLTLQSEMIMPAASVLPPREVASDVMLVVELTSSVPVADDTALTLIQICHLIYDISYRAKLELTSCHLVIEFLDKIIECFTSNIDHVQHFGMKRMLMETLHILGELVDRNGGNWSSSEISRLAKLLLRVVSFMHTYLSIQPYSHAYHDNSVAARTKSYQSENLREVQTIAFNMLGDAFSRTGSSVSDDMWRSALEVLRTEMDALAARNILIEESVMSKYYASVLRCLHLVLADRRAPVSDHVAGFVAALKLFFTYGVARTSLLRCSNASSSIVEHDPSKRTIGLVPKDSMKSEHGRYRPPHLRKRETMKQTHNDNGSGPFPSTISYTTSDSEQSDNDGQSKAADRYRSSKARAAAIICIQDLCQADPKSLSAQLSILLPTDDVLQPCSYQPTLMTCLLFDPVLKTRMAAASALAALLDGSSSLFLQVAEYKEFPRFSSFTTLSSSLGQILMQLHSGLLYLIQHEKHCGFLASTFKVLQLLVSATPYARMPGKVLPTVISSVQMRGQELFSAKTDETSLVAAAISCLGSAFSISPSVEVMEMLKAEISTGKSGSILMLFQLAEVVTYPNICFEALQALKSLLHNYPHIMSATWDKVSAITFGVSQISICDSFATKITLNLSRVDSGNSSREAAGRCVVAAIKVLDEYLRVVSGFKGMDDHLDDRLLDAISEFPRRSKVSSAPFFQEEVVQEVSEEMSVDTIGSKHWSEAIEKHISPMLLHAAAMVRAASITCFSGLTAPVFFSLTKEKQHFVLSSVISAALHDKVPSVRSSACRAVGVIACFQQISVKDLEELIHAVEVNTHDELVSVRITASWALANICDALRYKASNAHTDFCLTGLNIRSSLLSLLAECALRLTQDNDKVKANAVRALGNLSRFVDFMGVYGSDSQSSSTEQASPYDARGNHVPNTRFRPTSLSNSYWLERMVQAFVSCVTTGNVKVQWNVCHALANLFLNEQLVLHDMPWISSVYSILLLLLRDSSNFKIRIHAAAALAVPAARCDYGSFFPNVLQGLAHVLETLLHSDHITTPSSFKYRDALEEQLTSTMLHVLSLISADEPRPVKDFLIKKAEFLEEWMSSLENAVSNYPSTETSTMEYQEDPHSSTVRRKDVMRKALRSLVQLYDSCNNQSLAERIQKLFERLP